MVYVGRSIAHMLTEKVFETLEDIKKMTSK